MKAIDIAKIFQKLQRSSAKGQNPEEERKPRGKGYPKFAQRKDPGSRYPQGKGNWESTSPNPSKERDQSAEQALKRLERENQILYDQLVRAASVIRDLEAKHAELSHKQRIGTVIVSGLLHDLRNPLAVISSCAQLSLEVSDLDPSMRERLQMILESSQKAHRLTKQFLSYAKSSVLDFKPVNINRLLLVMWKMSELESVPCQMTFDARLAKDLPEIMGSPENLERVFLNLFMNALHAVSKKGTVIVETRLLPTQDSVEIKVTDNGPGIPQEQQARIFEPFFTTKENGTGLGLSICQSIILQHKGSISIESTGARGTTVSIQIPVLQNESSEGQAEAFFIREK
jgi:signal transduction histidine kinase